MGSEDDNDEPLVALREALASRGLNTQGTFAQLEERLVDAIAAEQSAAEVEVNTLSVKELKDLITKARMTFEDCIDKADLKVRATEALAALATAKAAHQPMFAKDTFPTEQNASKSDPDRSETTEESAEMVQRISALSLKDLKGLIAESGLSADDCTDKTELRERACQALQRLMIPGAKCGPIGKMLIEEAAQRAAAAAAAKEAEVRAAKDAAKEQLRAEKAAAEAVAAEAAAAAVAAKKEREKEKRKEKRTRKKENKAKAQAAGATKDDDDDDDDDEGAAAEDEDEELLLRLAASRLQSGPALDGLQGAAEHGQAIDVADASEGNGLSDEQGTDRPLPAGWRSEGGLLLEEGESAPAKKVRPKNKKR